MDIESGKFSTESEDINNEYKDVLNIIRDIDTICDKEDGNWDPNKLEDYLLNSFKKAGEEALKDNNGIIYATISGGIDSTLSLALLRKSLGDDIKIITFTMGGDENHPDIKNARIAIKKYNTEHYEFIPTSKEIQSGLEDFKKDQPDQNLKEVVSKGDFDIYLLFKKINKLGLQPGRKTIIACDGIDEQLGGYWAHRKDATKEERREIFRSLWQKLETEHIIPLIRSTQKFSVHLIFPYLEEELVKFISKIPVEDRIINKSGKIPLKNIADKLGVPEEMIHRQKRGAIGILEIENRREGKI